MFRVLAELRRSGLLSIRGMSGLIGSLAAVGPNPMALLRLSAKRFPDRVAITDDFGSVTWSELWRQAERVAGILHERYTLRRGQKVAIACRDHTTAVIAIFAASRIGAHVTLINPGTTGDQLRSLQERIAFDLFVHDDSLADFFAESPFDRPVIPTHHDSEPSIAGFARETEGEPKRLRRATAGRIIVMTGGTTGRPKSASRKTSPFIFVPPFCALLSDVRLGRHRSVYIATPLFHGFGLASLFIGTVLGVTMFLTGRFEAETACRLIDDHGVEVVTVVPLMLQRMLRVENTSLESLECVISGGALLSPALAKETLDRLGPKLFNMYGTSEAGVCIMASPENLASKPESIGRPLAGVLAGIFDGETRITEPGQTGRLRIRSAWTTSRKAWVETGDLAHRDADGDLFLAGRIDDMIVSGGENVYPIELEHVLVTHPDIEACGVIGIPDAEFGQRLKAVIKPKSTTTLDEPTLRKWLQSRVARHQMPAVIEFREELPHTPLGKLDKKALRAECG